MEVPVLINHDHDKPVGVLRDHEGALFIEFTEDVKITKEMAFEIFGNAGLQILDATEESGIFYIRKARIIEFSLDPHHLVVPNAKGVGLAGIIGESHTTDGLCHGPSSEN